MDYKSKKRIKNQDEKMRNGAKMTLKKIRRTLIYLQKQAQKKKRVHRLQLSSFFFHCILTMSDTAFMQ